MGDLEMNSDFAGVAQQWCPHCGQYYAMGTNHQCFGTQPGSTASGYVCPNCNVWVDYGTSHFCGSFTTEPSLYPASVELSPRQEMKLDRIIQLLEELVLKLTDDLPEQEGE